MKTKLRDIKSVEEFFDTPSSPRLDILLLENLDDVERLRKKIKIKDDLLAKLIDEYTSLVFHWKESSFLKREAVFEVYSVPYKLGFLIRNMIGVGTTGFIIESLAATDASETRKFLLEYKDYLLGREK